MNRPRQATGEQTGHASWQTVRGVLLVACLLASACCKTPDPVVVVVEKPAAPPFDPAKAFPRADAPRTPVSRQPEPLAIQARQAAIRRDADAIAAECRRAAGGDWDRWERDTAVYRAALKARIDPLKTIDQQRSVYYEAQNEPLEARDDFPLYEVGPRAGLQFLYQPDTLDAFRKDPPIVTAHRWLRHRGIDLIFVPVPRMTEVYIEHFLDTCPADGIIAPHVRRMIYELLNEGVEVVDGLPLFRSLRDADPEYLYNTADSHWAPRAMRIMAKEVADRIVRYKFGASARYALPIVTTAPDRFSIQGFTGPEHVDTATDQYGWAALTEQQQARARPAQTSSFSRVTMPNGQEVPADRESPVILMGNSFAQHFREQLVKEMNLLVSDHWRPASNTDMFTDFLRDPEALKHCKVVVWVASVRHLQDFKPLPDRIQSSPEVKERPK
jgi:hypothetical protein